MSFSTTNTEIFYSGNGTDSTFAIPFEFVDSVSVKVQLFNTVVVAPAVVTPVDLVLNTDFTIVGTNVNLIVTTIDIVTGNPVVNPRPMLTTEKLRVYRDTLDSHQQTYSTYQFPYATVATDFDRIYQRIQELKTELKYAIQFGKYSYQVDGDRLTGEEIYQRLTDLEASLAASGGMPVGGLDGDFLQKDTTAPAGTAWVSGSYSGFSARFSAFITTTSLDDAIKQIFNFQYTAPSISLSTSPSNSIREKGTVVSSVTLNATTTKRSNPITGVTFYRAGALVNTVATPNPAGAVESYVSATPFSDTMSFYAQVTDGTSTTTSNTVTHTYVYPYYYGVGAAGLTGTQIAALTKDVRVSTANVAFTSSPSSQKFYFAYPSAYPALTSILDQNGFETIGAYTVRTVSITGLDTTSQSYRVYELTLATTQTSFTNTYKQ